MYKCYEWWVYDTNGQFLLEWGRENYNAENKKYIYTSNEFVDFKYLVSSVVDHQ